MKFNEPKVKEIKEPDDDSMQKLLQKLESIELNQVKLISNHAKGISTL